MKEQIATLGGKLLEYILTNHRDIFAVLFLLPLSALYEAFLYFRNKIVFWLSSAPHKHNERVQFVQSQIKQWKDEGSLQKLCTARPGWQTMSMLVGIYKRTAKNIVIDMKDVLLVDTNKKIVRVEPFCTMGQITATLNPLGWTLPVIPELDDLTVGGLIMGFGVESSSHKYGLFQYICEAFEIVTAEGKLVRCTKDENPELFDLIPWSHGTLGFLVAAEIRIIPARKYVHLQYLPTNSLDEMVKLFEKESRDTENNDFVELLVYSKNTGVVMTGKLTDDAESGKINSIGKWYKPWFYKHAESFLTKNKKGDEYVPLREYYHRHTKSLFWEVQDIISFGNHPVFRFLLGWALPLKVSLLKLTETETTRKLYEQHHVLQDMLVPISTLKDSLQYFDQEFKLYPLWVCPMAVYDRKSGFLHPLKKEDGTKDEMFVDIGAYGNPPVRPYDPKAALRRCEAFVLKHNGYQALYAETLLTREQFRQMFDHSTYDKVRKDLPLCEKAFPEVYDKVSSSARESMQAARRNASKQTEQKKNQ